MLTEAERQMMKQDMADLISLSGETAQLSRSDVVGAGSFGGPTESVENDIAVVPIEFRQLSPEEVQQIGADGMCAMLPDTDVREGDVVLFNNIRFVVTDVRSENCFGVVTHLTVKLEREYRKRP